MSVRDSGYGQHDALQRGRARAGAECGGVDEGLDLALVLQRGRARAGAEWSGNGLTISGVLTLQRGRARAGAEWVILGKVSHFYACRFNGAAPARARNGSVARVNDPEGLELQRGRARAGAECRQTPHLHAGTRSFNGAAPARARNERAQPAGDCGGDGLQRGRARAGAEWRPKGMGSAPRCVRFNGAAPARARNDVCPHCGFVDDRDVLQRGRARAGAECWSRPIWLRTLVKWLQRGRARAGAEWPRLVVILQNGAVASTGPRPRGRGMSLIWNGSAWAPGLQRGRARAGAE